MWVHQLANITVVRKCQCPRCFRLFLNPSAPHFFLIVASLTVLPAKTILCCAAEEAPRTSPPLLLCFLLLCHRNKSSFATTNLVKPCWQHGRRSLASVKLVFSHYKWTQFKKNKYMRRLRSNDTHTHDEMYTFHKMRNRTITRLDMEHLYVIIDVPRQ